MELFHTFDFARQLERQLKRKSMELMNKMNCKTIQISPTLKDRLFVALTPYGSKTALSEKTGLSCSVFLRAATTGRVKKSSLIRILAALGWEDEDNKMIDE